MRRIYATLLAGLILLAFQTTPIFAQAVTGTMHGLVSDTSGARVPGVNVIAVHTATGESRSASTDESGEFVFPVLAIGEYRVEVEHSGFKKFVRAGVMLNVNSNVRLDVTLEVGQVTEEVRVTADAAMVDTRQAQIGGLVDERRVNDLPLSGRNVYDLVSILPGVAATRFLVTPDNQGNALNVNGSRQFHSTFMIDGGFNNDLFRNSGNAAPNPDAVQEFRLITSNFSAEFGRNSGAVFNVVTKSGTNQFHGTLFEFLRNDVLNARSFFQPTVSSLRQNQFGGTVGGPIIKNKTFFFLSYQGLRIHNGVFQNTALTPTAAERAGNFSAAPAAQRPFDPLTGQAFPNAIIPASRLDPVAAKIIALVPLPSNGDRLEVSAPRTSTEDQGVIKIDHQLTQKHKLYGTLFILQNALYDPYAAANQIPSYAPANTSFHQANTIVNEDWTISPAMLNQFRFSLTRRLWDTSTPVRTTWKDWGSKITLGSEPGRGPQIIVNGRWRMGQNTEFHQPQTTPSFSETLSWVHGNHSVKVGTWVLLNHYRELTNWLGSGQVTFAASNTTTRNSLADLMLGMAASLRQNSAADRDFSSTNWHSFVQDDWRIHRKVTLNLGLRYELNTPFVEPRDWVQTFRFGQQSTQIPRAPLGLLFPGDKGIPRGIVPTDKNNFAPRFGFAIDPFGNGKTAIRGGYGIFYSLASETFANSLQGQPFFADVTIFGTPNLIDPWASVPGGSPFPYTFDPAKPLFSLPVTASWLSGNLATPYVQQYNFTIEQQLMKDLSLQVSYVGNTSRKLFSQRDANAPIFGPGSTAANVNNRRPYLPGIFAQISDIQSSANGHYDSLQAVMNRRFSHGLSILASYTLAKSMDDAGDDVQNNTDTMMQDPNNRKAERAPSNFDTRHVFIASYMWQLPQVSRWGAFGKQVLSGWSINGITRADSGSSINVVTGTDTNLDGVGTYDRPNLVGNAVLSSDRSRDDRLKAFFNTAAFGPVATGGLGNAGRNIMKGPGSINWNASIFKNFSITERKRLQFRSEFFNLFNHTNLSNPVSIMSNPNFGKIQASSGGRVVQFGMKFIY